MQKYRMIKAYDLQQANAALFNSIGEQSLQTINDFVKGFMQGFTITDNLIIQDADVTPVAGQLKVDLGLEGIFVLNVLGTDDVIVGTYKGIRATSGDPWSTEELTFSANSSGNPRIDIIELEINLVDDPDFTETVSILDDTVDPPVLLANSKITRKVQEVTMYVKEGTPGASPIAPIVSAGRMVIKEIYVANGATEFTTGNIRSQTYKLADTPWTTAHSTRLFPQSFMEVLHRTGDVMEGDLDMDENKLINPEDPTDATGVGDRGYNDMRYLNIAGDTMQGPINMNNQQFMGPLDPISGSHVGDRSYNDARYDARYAKGFYEEGLIKDITFRRQFWTLSDANVTYGLNGAGGKESIDFVANSVEHSVLYEDPAYGDSQYIPVTESIASIHFGFRMKTSGTVAGSGNLFEIRMRRYDKDHTFINTSKYFLTSSEMTSNFRTYLFALNVLVGGDGTAYIDIFIVQTANMTSGTIHLDYISATHFPNLPGVMQMQANGIYNSWYRGENGVRGGTPLHWLTPSSGISVGLTAANYLLLGSKALPFQIKGVYLKITIGGSASSGLDIYSGDSGTTRIIPPITVTWVKNNDTSNSIGMIFPSPVSSYNGSTGEAYLRMATNSSSGCILYPLAYIL